MLTKQIGPAMRHHQREKFGRRRSQVRGLGGGGQELEPVKAVALQSEEVRQFANRRKDAAPKEFDRLAAAPLGQIEFDRLRSARQIGHAKDDFVAISAYIGDNLAVRRIEEPQGTPAKSAP